MPSAKPIPSSSAFDDFLVILSIGGRLIDALAVEKSDAAPAIDQRLKVRLFAACRRSLAFLANFASVPKEFIEDLRILPHRNPSRTLRFRIACADLLVARQQFFDLDRIVGHELRRRIDRGQTATDDAGRQAYLQIGQRRPLRGAGQLQRHQKVRRLADTANQIVLQLDDRRLAGAGRDRNVIESEVPGVLDRQRFRRNARRRSSGKLARRARDEINDLQEILVPADRNAVLGNAAESGQHALVEIVVERFEISDRLRRVLAVADEIGRQWLDLQRVDADDAEPLVQKIMREGIAGRPEPHDQRIRCRDTATHRDGARSADSSASAGCRFRTHRA